MFKNSRSLCNSQVKQYEYFEQGPAERAGWFCHSYRRWQRDRKGRQNGNGKHG